MPAHPSDANRSEIAIRVMRAAAEMNIRTVVIYSKEDRLSLHRFKADESYVVSEHKRPLAALSREPSFWRTKWPIRSEAASPPA